MNDTKLKDNLYNKAQREVAKITQLREILEGEEITSDVVSDFLEGETEVFEALDCVWKEIEERKIMLVGLEAHISEMNTRKTRVKNSIESLRNIFLMVAKTAGINEKTIKRDCYTATFKDTPETVIIDDESALPSIVFEVQEPKISTKKIKELLQSGEKVKGARLSEKGITIQIRNK